jgi:hypothetical protein
MQEQTYRRRRRREVLTGLLIILVTFSYLTSLLLDFKFVSPYSTVQDDLSYLSNHIESQQISTWSWLITSLITFLAIPVFLSVFHKRLRILQYINGLWLLGASVGFLMMGIAGLELSHELARGVLSGTESSNEETWIRLLGLYQKELDYRHIGSSFVGLFTFGLGLTRFKIKKFPIVATILLLICGPTMIFYNSYDPENLITTIAMAGNMIGVAIFSVRLINKSL